MIKFKEKIYNYAIKSNTCYKAVCGGILWLSLILTIISSVLWLIGFYHIGMWICDVSHSVHGYLPNLAVLTIGVICIFASPVGFFCIIFGGLPMLSFFISNYIGIPFTLKDLSNKESPYINHARQPKNLLNRHGFCMLLYSLNIITKNEFILWNQGVQLEKVIPRITQNSYVIELHRDNECTGIYDVKDFTIWFKEAKSQYMNLGKSVNSLCKSIGVSNSDLEHIEAGTRPPEIQTFLYIVNTFGYNIIIKQNNEQRT